MSDQPVVTPVVATPVEYTKPLPNEPKNASKTWLIVIPLLLAILGLIFGAAIGVIRYATSPRGFEGPTG